MTYFYEKYIENLAGARKIVFVKVINFVSFWPVRRAIIWLSNFYEKYISWAMTVEINFVEVWIKGLLVAE
jgi:hypothetical protein